MITANTIQHIEQVIANLEMVRNEIKNQETSTLKFVVLWPSIMVHYDGSKISTELLQPKTFGFSEANGYCSRISNGHGERPVMKNLAWYYVMLGQWCLEQISSMQNLIETCKK